VSPGDRVEGGRPYSDEYDQGHVVSVDGDQVTVAWESGASTTQRLESIRAGWSERWMTRVEDEDQ
jgi:outer membrane protein assembly factor BamB